MAVSEERWEEILQECLSRSMLEPARLEVFRWLVDMLPAEGAIAEVGVLNGGTTGVLARLLPRRDVLAFDTLSGMPALARQDEPALTAGSYMTDGDTPMWLWLNFPNVLFLPGVFPGSIPVGLNDSFALVHLDADLFQTTRDALAFFWPRMVPGGFVVMDDYGRAECPGVRRAALWAGVARWRHVWRYDRGLSQMVLRKSP